jgi:hypothetical protein
VGYFKGQIDHVLPPEGEDKFIHRDVVHWSHPAVGTIQNISHVYNGNKMSASVKFGEFLGKFGKS